MLRAPRSFIDEVLWPEFEALNAALVQYLNAVTLRVIRDEVHGDASEAAELAVALRP
jgi:tRNA nucleotidyltransferase (CCA-adding enzyme)